MILALERDAGIFIRVIGVAFGFIDAAMGIERIDLSANEGFDQSRLRRERQIAARQRIKRIGNLEVEFTFFVLTGQGNVAFPR